MQTHRIAVDPGIPRREVYGHALSATVDLTLERLQRIPNRSMHGDRVPFDPQFSVVDARNVE